MSPSSPLCPAFILSIELHCCKAKGYSFIYTIQCYANEQALIINISQMNLYKLTPLTLPGARRCSPVRTYLSSWAVYICTNVCSTQIPTFFLDPFSPNPTWFEPSTAWASPAPECPSPLQAVNECTAVVLSATDKPGSEFLLFCWEIHF